MTCHSLFKVLLMKKKMAIFLALLQMSILGVAQTPNDSCIVRKDSLCQNPSVNKPDSVNLFFRKHYLFRTDITLKKDNRSTLPKINISSKDYYREKFSTFNLINIIGSHLPM